MKSSVPNQRLYRTVAAQPPVAPRLPVSRGAVMSHTGSMTKVTLSLPPDTDTANVRPIATFLERARRVWGVNEFLKPVSNHRSVKGTELQEDAKRFNALVRTHAVLLWHLHRCGESADYACSFLGVDRPPHKIADTKL